MFKHLLFNKNAQRGLASPLVTIMRPNPMIMTPTFNLMTLNSASRYQGAIRLH